MDQWNGYGHVFDDQRLERTCIVGMFIVNGLTDKSLLFLVVTCTVPSLSRTVVSMGS